MKKKRIKRFREAAKWLPLFIDRVNPRVEFKIVTV